MKLFYKNLSERKKLLLLIGAIILSFPAGALIGALVGLVSTTFVPICCNDFGCQSCFEFNGLVGYEALALFGFYSGILVLPMISISLIIYLKTKGRL